MCCHGHTEQNCSCGCHRGHVNECSSERTFQRRYQTKAEQIAELEAYLSDLKAEIQAVEERLVDLRN